MLNRTIPADFPREKPLASVPGVQPKVVARLVNGQYIIGLTDEEWLERYEGCEDLARQFVSYCTRKVAENPALTRELCLVRARKRRVDLESCARPEDVLTRCSHYAAHAKIPCRRINVALSDCQVQIQLVNNAIKLPIRWRLMRRWLNRNSDAALLDVAGIEVLRLGVPPCFHAGHQDEVLQCRLRPARQHHCSD